MSKQEINKYLTEQVFEECWHSMHKVNGLYNCSKCMEVSMQELTFLDFFSFEGCMKLWLEIQKKDWFGGVTCWNKNKFCLSTKAIHPDRLAPAVYEFLKRGRNRYESQ